TVPANRVAGQDITISYQVTNDGGNPANGSWYDSLYLAPSQTWSAADPLLGTVYQTQDLNTGSSYTGTLTASLPGIAPGSYYVILRTNVLDNLPEATLSNNQSASLTEVSIDALPLTLGTPVSSTLAQGQSTYYKATVAAGQTLQLTLDSGTASAANQLYASLGTMPTLGQFDYHSSQSLEPDPQITIP